MKTDVQEAWSLELVKRQQDSSLILSQIKSLLVSKETPPKDVDEDLNFYYKKMPSMSVGEDGILRHIGTENSETGQIVIPRSLTSRVLQMMHVDLGHFGTAKKSARVRERFFWPSMSPVPAKRAPLQQIVTHRPGELVTIDIVEYPLSSQGYRYCLVMVDRTVARKVARTVPTKEPEVGDHCQEGF